MFGGAARPRSGRTGLGRPPFARDPGNDTMAAILLSRDRGLEYLLPKQTPRGAKETRRSTATPMAALFLDAPV